MYIQNNINFKNKTLRLYKKLFDALEIIKRLIKTMIKVNGSHEFIRNRLRIRLEK